MRTSVKVGIGVWSAAVGIFVPGALLQPVAQADELISTCERLPSGTAIEVFTIKEASDVCREVLRVLDRPTVTDLQKFQKASYLLQRQGYKKDYASIAAELVDIIRLRGLYDKQDRWSPTIDLVYKSYVAFNGIVSPQEVIDFLNGAGPMAKTLSDDGLRNMIILMKQQRQRGN
jgi:hypothetical protein